MSRDLSNSDWVERNLESTRRRVKQLEIEACRIRTDLAQLEVANATGVVQGAIAPDVEQPVTNVDSEKPLDWQPVAELIPDGMEILVGAPPVVPSPIATEVSGPMLTEAVPAGESWVSGLVSRSCGAYRRVTSPVMASLVAHAVVIILAVSITVVTIERNDARSTTTTLVLGDKPSKEVETFDPRQLADLGETGGQNMTAEMPVLEAVGPVDREPIPIEFESLASSEPVGKMGLSDVHDTELGKLPSGVGGLGKDGQGAGAGLAGGKPGSVGKSPRSGSRMDSTLFFGMAAKGNRFVFVVDNSSSMKGGRLEMAVAELVKTVEGLSAKQSFYVIFVSDKPYPMFIGIPPPANVEHV
jgi:hypothetical protein